MKKIECGILCLSILLACVCSIFADKQSVHVDAPLYIEGTNGLFSVCSYEKGTNIIRRWKNVYAPESEVYSIGPFRFGYVYRSGERPKKNLNPFHIYDPPPFQIEDIDPPIEFCVGEDGSLLVGFKYVHGTFYAIEEIKKPELKVTLPKANWSKVIRISVPKQRVHEVHELLNNVIKDKGPSVSEPGIGRID